MARHQDVFAEETKRVKIDFTSDFEPFNSAATDEDVVISHPDVSRDKIEIEKPLLVAMARENRRESPYNESAEEYCMDDIFDEALCDVAELALQLIGMGDCDVAIYKLRALMIQIARDIDHFKKLAEYVSQYSADEIDQFGLGQSYGMSTYRKAAKNLKQDDEYELLVESTFVAVHALYWNGLPIPDPVKDKYDLSYDADPVASDFSDGARQVALYALVDDLLDIVADHLSLDREYDDQTMKCIVATFAHAAYSNESIESYKQTAQHLFSLEPALPASTLRKRIDELPVWQVKEMFDEINQALLRYVLESEAVTKPVTVGYDLTDIESLGVGRINENFVTDDGYWRFSVLSFTDSELEFSFALRLLKSEAQRSVLLENTLENLTSLVDVRRLLLDRGFDSAEDIEVCRRSVPGRWVNFAQDYSDTSGRNDDYTRLREKIKPGKTTFLRSAGYDNLHPPVKLLGYSGASEDDDTVEPLRGFYSDIDLPDDPEEREELITDINFHYDQRAKMEKMFAMIKNTLDVATDTEKPNRKLFYLNMSLLFYNLYKIVKTVPSPYNGLELDTTQKELLQVTRNLAFGGPTRPDALEYWVENS